MTAPKQQRPRPGALAAAREAFARWMRRVLPRAPCRHCAGTGVAAAGQVCPHCGGKGRPA
jgi:DnaJ-class molecular chaperone